MIVRALTVAGGIAGAAGMSQFPEFSQQYIQRLGGAVDELSRAVDNFDKDAAKVGLTRDEALSELAQGSDLGAERSDSMAALIARHARLSADLEALKQAGPFTRASMLSHLSDSDVARRAFADYKPAVPATFEGAVFGGTGFLAGILTIWAALKILLWPFGRRHASA